MPREPNWLVESVTAPRQDLRSQESARSGRDRERRRPTQPSAPCRWPSTAKCSRAKQVDVAADGRATGRISVARIAVTDSTKPKSASSRTTLCMPRRPLSVRHRARRSASGAVPARRSASSTRELYYRAALESVPEAGFALEPLAVEQAANQSLSKYAFVVLSDVGSHARRPREQLAQLRQRGRLAAGGAGSDSAALQRRAGFRRSHPGNQLRRARRRPLPAGRHAPMPSIPRCAAPTSWMACSSTRWCASIPATRA